MTDMQKTQIEKLRYEGMGYSKIASALNISVNTVSSYCRRHQLSGVMASADTNISEKYFCQCCGILVSQNAGRKEKKFCSDKCRMKWWNSHLDQVKRKAVYKYTCLYCGKAFEVYGNANRKYCSHQCYIEDRFGGE